MARPIRTLLFSTLYPSSAQPGHGIFVETRLRELLGSGEVEAKVVAPVPWFPSTNKRWGAYAKMAATPLREVRNGIDVAHPRYPLLPKVGMSVAPLLLAAWARRAVQRAIDDGFDFDLIDAHYFYPDGVAAAMLAHWFRRPLVITARGSDVNLIATHALPQRMMRWAAGRAAACIGVSSALAGAMRNLGMPEWKIHVMRNGVDLDRFKPVSQAQARVAIRQEGNPLLLSVGNLVALKGHELCIDALALLLPAYPEAQLVIVGEGPLHAELLRHARSRGVESKVTLAGQIDNADLALWYSAADFLLLASSREGWPNVLLEALACGTPVISTRVGGIPEVIREELAGNLIATRDGYSLAEAIAKRLASRPTNDRAAVRRYAESFGWAETSRAQVELFSAIVGGVCGAQHA